MADYYVYSSAAGTGSGADWTNAFTTVAAALSGKAAGDRFFVADDHAESNTTNGAITSPGTAASPCQIFCVRRSGGSVPPVDADLRTTATVTTTGANSIAFAGYATCHGISFFAGSGGANAAGVTFTSTSDWWWRFGSCVLAMATTASSQRVTIGASGGGRFQKLELFNTSFKFAIAGQGISPRGGELQWDNSTALASGGTAPTILFVAQTSVANGRFKMTARGLDLSAMSAGTLIDVSSVTPATFEFQDCKLGAAAKTTGSVGGQGGVEVRFTNCDSGNTQTKSYRQVYPGTVTDETTIVRTGGASDGTTTVSRKMVTTANSKLFAPLQSDWMEFWTDTIGSQTVSIPVITDNVTLTNADAWGEVEYQGTSGFPLAVNANSRVASSLATPANQSTDTSTWTTTGLTTPVKQKLDVTFTTVAKGVVRVRVCLAKPSTTMYVDPKPLSGSSRQWMAGSGLYVNEGVAAGGSAVFPAVGTVFLGTTFGPTGADYTGTRTDANRNYVIAANGNYGDPGAQLVPRATIPAAGDVDSTASTYGVFGALTTPTFAVPAVTNVASGVQYGAGGTEFTGTYSGGGGGVTLTQLQSVIDTQTAALESNLANGLTSQSASDLTGIGSLLTARLIKVPRVGQTYLDTNTMQVADADVSGTDLAAAVAAELADDFAAIPAATADKALGRNLAGGGDGGRTVRDALRSARNRIAFDVPAAGQFTVYAEDDATPAWTGAYTRDAAKVGSLTSLNPAGGSA